MSARKENWQGMNWIRQEKRLAIYLRDGMACAWCGTSVEQGVTLTLDHLLPHVKGGSNHETNLVTCCHTCNSSRGKRTQANFARAVAKYRRVRADEILAHVRRTSARSLKPFKLEARKLVVRRGSAAKALAAM